MAEIDSINRSFQRFSWLNENAKALHGPHMSDAFDRARDVVHGTGLVLEMMEFCHIEAGMDDDKSFLDVGDIGSLKRFLITTNKCAAEYLWEACDRINQCADEAATQKAQHMADFETRR